jgi:hypothetical protein
MKVWHFLLVTLRSQGIRSNSRSTRAKYEVAFSIRSQMLYPVEIRAPGKR